MKLDWTVQTCKAGCGPGGVPTSPRPQGQGFADTATAQETTTMVKRISTNSHLVEIFCRQKKMQSEQVSSSEYLTPIQRVEHGGLNMKG